ncbi:hypothetical protein BGZ76_007662, partial [Entomortierella beljakovae]
MAIKDSAKRRLFVSRSLAEKAANWEAASAIFRNVCRTTSDMVKVNEELLKITIGQKECFRDFADCVSTHVEATRTPDDNNTVYLQVWSQLPNIYQEILQDRHILQHLAATLLKEPVPPFQKLSVLTSSLCLIDGPDSA